jgi:hypothetical protein
MVLASVLGLEGAGDAIARLAGLEGVPRYGSPTPPIATARAISGKGSEFTALPFLGLQEDNHIRRTTIRYALLSRPKISVTPKSASNDGSVLPQHVAAFDGGQ